MVATRRGAKKAPEVAPAPSNTLNAPPKRGGRKKAAVEEAAEPAPAIPKLTKTTASKRKAQAEPEDAEPPMAKKTVATKAARSAKLETKVEPASAAPKRATRVRKAEQPAVVEEPDVVEEAPKPAATRPRKIAAKKAPAPKKVEAPAIVEEPAIEEAVAEEAPKPAATRTRKTAAKKAPEKVEEAAVVEEPVVEEVPAPKPASRARKAPAKKVEVAVTGETIVAEPAKPAPRARKAAVPKASAPAPVLAPRATRGRNAAAVPQESPLKAPARRPTKKAAAVTVAKAEPEPVEEPFAEYPRYPTTPAHIAAPLTSNKAMAELPHYPSTPAHIHAPISNEDALAALPGYPKTPAHITAPISTKAALAELPGYPKTPAHIKAPISVKDAMAEMPEYPKTPAHIVAPIVQIAPVYDNDLSMEDANDLSIEEDIEVTAQANNEVGMPEDDEVAIEECNESARQELPDCPTAPANIKAPISASKSWTELSESPRTSAPAEVSTTPVKPTTPAHAASPGQATSVQATPGQATSVQATPGQATPVQATPVQATTPFQVTTPVGETAAEIAGISTHIVWGVTDQEAFEELPAAYPTTPAHIAAPITSKAGLAELPDYPKTPAHINAPLTPRRALAELPDYPTTPAMALEAAIQEEIGASVKKQTPSPLKFSDLEDLGHVPFQFAEFSEITETSEITEIDATDIDSEAPSSMLKPNMQFAPPQHAPSMKVSEPASPIKSALRSPQKTDAKTPKKAVTWEPEHDESDMFLYEARPLQGMTFYVDVTRNGKDQNYLFSSLLEDLGAKVVKDWSSPALGHVLFKDGSISTLEKCLASKGAIKCVNVGWVLDSEANGKRMDETPYLVDLSVAKPTSPLPTVSMKPFTPAKTPSKYALPPSSQCKDLPSTPTSSEFDRSFNDEKENLEPGIFFDCLKRSPIAPRTVPNKKSSFLFSRSPIKTPSKLNFLDTPAKHSLSAVKPSVEAFSTSKKQPAEFSFFTTSLGPPKKLRLW